MDYKEVDNLGITPPPWYPKIKLDKLSVENGNYLVCDFGNPNDILGDGLNTAKSDINLISAAPDLYKALTNIIKNYHENNNLRIDVSALIIADVAIKKAQGET